MQSFDNLQASVGMSFGLWTLERGVLMERFSGCASDCSDEDVVDRDEE